jgi:hypothetical protein
VIISLSLERIASIFRVKLIREDYNPHFYGAEISYLKKQTSLLSMLIFWAVTAYGLVGGYQRFGGTYCLHLQGFATQKTNFMLFVEYRKQTLVCSNMVSRTDSDQP